MSSNYAETELSGERKLDVYFFTLQDRIGPIKDTWEEVLLSTPCYSWSDGQEGWVTSGTVQREKSLLTMLWDVIRMLWM